MIAALFVETNGAYFGLPDVDPWDIKRDALKYTGPHPVVAHPPCSVWCQLAHVNQKRYGHKVGEDDGCFESALRSVRTYGGVLEHPARSLAWKRFGLREPVRGRWCLGSDGSFVTEVSQSAYGHRARKRTWLYVVSEVTMPQLDWSEPEATALVSYCKNHGGRDLPRLSKREAKATPPAFREMLISLAEGR